LVSDAGDYWAEVQVEEALNKFAGSDRVIRHQWDDPYGSLTPQYDPTGH